MSTILDRWKAGNKFNNSTGIRYFPYVLVTVYYLRLVQYLTKWRSTAYCQYSAAIFSVAERIWQDGANELIKWEEVGSESTRQALCH